MVFIIWNFGVLWEFVWLFVFGFFIMILWVDEEVKVILFYVFFIRFFNVVNIVFLEIFYLCVYCKNLVWGLLFSVVSFIICVSD